MAVKPRAGHALDSPSVLEIIINGGLPVALEADFEIKDGIWRGI